MSYFYEADNKGSSNLDNFKDKMRRHFHYVARQKRHREDYKVPRIRAVLTETFDRPWAETLIEETRDRVVTSSGNPSPLFWFIPSEFFLTPKKATLGGETTELARFLVEPKHDLPASLGHDHHGLCPKSSPAL